MANHPKATIKYPSRFRIFEIPDHFNPLSKIPNKSVTPEENRKSFTLESPSIIEIVSGSNISNPTTNSWNPITFRTPL
jgi:hypothetical protein